MLFWAHFLLLKAPLCEAKNRAIRSNSSTPRGGLRDFRFYPLRVPKSGILPDFGIGDCLRQTPSLRRRRRAMETAPSMAPKKPKAPFGG
jgi:hypothetical protein